MVLEAPPIPFAEWLWPAVIYFLQAAAVLGLAAVVIGFLIATFRYGPLEAGDMTYRMLKRGLFDLISISPRRVLALAWLAVQESLRRRVLVGFGVFLLILLFAGWFLDTRTPDPAKLYVSFVLTATTYLVLLMALFLSVFSLPADVKNKTIHTVVTKPVRPGEIVLGRILGFSLVGTLLLAIMGLVSYFFVVRVLSHTHEVEIATLEPIANDSAGGRAGRTSLESNHRHRVTIDAAGKGATDVVNGHWHEIDPRTDGDKISYVVGPPQDLFMARVPQYGELVFKDRAGNLVSRGSNVGKEDDYQSFIEGATLAGAIWKFTGITPERYPEGLPVEMTIRVFRSHKGDIEQGIRGSLVLRNPRSRNVQSALRQVFIKDAMPDQHHFTRTLRDSEGKTIDLFADLAPGGELEVELQCLDSGQYLGAGRGDMYIRAANASFQINFLKGFLGIWVQMLMVTAVGVMFSTFLSGPVAMLATATVLIMGTRLDFIRRVAEGEVEGGGPVESFIRTYQQRNATMPLEPGLTTDVVQAIDRVFMSIMTALTGLMPDFGKFDNVRYVADGFDVPPDVILVQVLTALAFVAAAFALGYFFFRTREVAR
jgi:hypothetical protein